MKTAYLKVFIRNEDVPYDYGRKIKCNYVSPGVGTIELIADYRDLKDMSKRVDIPGDIIHELNNLTSQKDMEELLHQLREIIIEG